jgi:transposase
VVSKEDLGLAQENDRLPRENRILKKEWEILKKATAYFASQTPRGFKFIHCPAVETEFQ